MIVKFTDRYMHHLASMSQSYAALELGHHWLGNLIHIHKFIEFISRNIKLFFNFSIIS